MKVYRRSRKRFPTARKAWADIARKTGLTASSVTAKAHTRRQWVFHVS